MDRAVEIGIVGLGLIGGSLAKALKANNRHTRIVACDTNAADLGKALTEHVIDVGSDIPNRSFSNCSLIFLCIPVSAIHEVASALVPFLSDECLLVDTGSTKREVMELFSQMGFRHRFIGGHPMTGSERSGYSASRANLFENAWFVLTPYPETSADALGRVSNQVCGTGAMPIQMEASEHDHAAALISHMPHAIASLLVETVRDSDTGNGILRRLAAGGFKDITRIASSSPGLWSGISLSNRTPLRDALLQFRTGIDRFLHMLEVGDENGLLTFFQSAGTWRDALSVVRTERYMAAAEITVDVEDKPGIIASIAAALAARDINIKNIGINHVREEDEGALLIRFESSEERDFATSVLSEAGYGVKCRE